MRRTLSAAVVALAVLLGGCKAKELVDKARVARDLDKKGTVDLMKSVADDKYTPPSDGKLTDDQIRMYLKVREHEKQIAQVAKEQMQAHANAADKNKNSLAGMMEGLKTIGSAADLATADIRAAKDLGFNTQEYLWVKGQILMVSTTAFAEKTADVMNTQMDAAYKTMKKNLAEAKSEQEKKAYEASLAMMEKGRAEMSDSKKEDPAVAYNRQIVSKYQNELTGFVDELSKWTDKPGDTAKTADELSKKMDEAKAKAQKQQ